MGKNTRFDAQNFTGIVTLKNFTIMPNGRQCISVAGKVSVLTDKEVAGFEVKGGDTANWICRVDGPNGSVNILGCQVRLVHQFDDEMPEDLPTDVYLVP